MHISADSWPSGHAPTC